MIELSERSKRFLERKPTKLRTLAGYRFYECPIYGDEGILFVITPSGRLRKYYSQEIPDSDELEMWVNHYKIK